MKKHKISFAYEFVPFSKSRNAGEKHKSLNWKVTLKRDGRDILTTDYSAGVAHCPSYKDKNFGAVGVMTLMRDEAVTDEVENGHAVRRGYDTFLVKGKPLVPNDADVLASLYLDSDVLSYGGFEDWAPNLGYDPDSRAAEKIYRACLEIALRLRNGLGDAALTELGEAVQGY